MNTFTVCPYCKSTLLNEDGGFVKFGHVEEVLNICRKSCAKQSHNIYLIYDKDELIEVSTIYNEYKFIWMIEQKTFNIFNNLTKKYNNYNFQYFSPDFSSYRKLIDKAKMCLIFS